MKKRRISYCFLNILFILILSINAFCSESEEDFNLWFEYRIRGNYGDLPEQPEYHEKGYWWWKEGTLGYWENSLSISGKGTECFNDFDVNYLIELGTVSSRDRRDFEVWTDDYSPVLRMKQASAEIKYFIQTSKNEHELSLKAGKSLLSFPLFFEDRVYGGTAGFRLNFQVGYQKISRLAIDLKWHQIMAYEGKLIEEDVNYNDDIDLQGGELNIEFEKREFYVRPGVDPYTENVIPEPRISAYKLRNRLFVFKFTDAGSGRLGSNLDIFGYDAVLFIDDFAGLNFSYCLEQGDYYGYELKDYLYRCRFMTAHRLNPENKLKFHTEFLGRDSKRDYYRNYSFFNLLEEPKGNNYLFKPNPAMIDRLTFELIYERKFDKIISGASADLLYVFYHFDFADFNLGKEFDSKITIMFTETLNLEFAVGVSSFNGFYKGVYLSYKGSLI